MPGSQAGQRGYQHSYAADLCFIFALLRQILNLFVLTPRTSGELRMVPAATLVSFRGRTLMRMHGS
jgi:hypothetical protein